jgi:hypothetical protein
MYFKNAGPLPMLRPNVRLLKIFHLDTRAIQRRATELE